jgi:hypothetical protein
MSFSSDVSAGDTILASHYNNLRKDVVDITGHGHNGTDSKGILKNIASYLTGTNSYVTGGTTGISCSITTNGGSVLLLGRVYSYGSTTNSDIELIGNLERDGGVIDDTFMTSYSNADGSTSGKSSITIFYIDTQAAGTYIYRIHYKVTISTGSASTRGSIYAIELPY